MSVVGIVPPTQPRRGETPMQRLDAVCLEVCQLKPLEGSRPNGHGIDPDRRLVNATTIEERREMLRLADEVGIDVEGLVEVIRGNGGAYRGVIRELHELGLKKKDSR